MSYAAYLRDLLRPIGIYALEEDTLSGAEVEALGDAFDQVEAQAETAQRESILATAEDQGLSRRETLFARRPAAPTTELRRAASTLLITQASLGTALAVLGSLGAELLVVGHHGSKYSTSYELLAAIDAEYAAISVGYNSYGHPTEEALLRQAMAPDAPVYQAAEEALVIEGRQRGEPCKVFGTDVLVQMFFDKIQC